MAHYEHISITRSMTIKEGDNYKKAEITKEVFLAPGEVVFDMDGRFQMSPKEVMNKIATEIDNELAEMLNAPTTNGDFQKASEVQKKTEGITEKQLSYIQKLLDDGGNTNTLLSNILRYNKVDGLTKLTKEQAGKAIDYLLSGVEE